MIRISLLVDENYIDEFARNLPIDKAIIVENDYEENKKKFHEVVNNYKQESGEFISYRQSADSITKWLKGKE